MKSLRESERHACSAVRNCPCARAKPSRRRLQLAQFHAQLAHARPYCLLKLKRHSRNHRNSGCLLCSWSQGAPNQLQPAVSVGRYYWYAFIIAYGVNATGLCSVVLQPVQHRVDAKTMLLQCTTSSISPLVYSFLRRPLVMGLRSL